MNDFLTLFSRSARRCSGRCVFAAEIHENFSTLCGAAVRKYEKSERRFRFGDAKMQICLHGFAFLQFILHFCKPILAAF